MSTNSLDPVSRQRMSALRGATTVEVDDAAAIIEAASELLRAMLERNEVDDVDVVSLIFTATPDLIAEFPAAAARVVGIPHVPRLCASEIPVPGALARCVRVLMHVYTARAASSLRHVYLRGAQSLQDDRP